MSNIGEVGDELTVEIGKAHERENVLELLGGGPRSNTIEFDRIHSKFIRMDDHVKVLNFRSGKLAFLQFKMQVQFFHALENPLGLLSMCGGIGGVDQEVIHVDNKPSLSTEISE